MDEKSSHRVYPFRRTGISRIEAPTVDELVRAGKHTVQDMVGHKDLQRVVRIGQAILVPIQLLVRLAFRISRIHLIQPNISADWLSLYFSTAKSYKASIFCSIDMPSLKRFAYFSYSTRSGTMNKVKPE